MSFFAFLKPKKINDELVGKDEKVCSCSVRIAEILQKSDAAQSNTDQKNLRQTVNSLKDRQVKKI